MINKFNHSICEKDSKLIDFQNEFNKKSLKATKDLFSIILPPPNLTGVLHIGHAWNATIQDFVIRYQKFINKNPIWIPGMDHAGIATQTKYENFLKEQNKYEVLVNKNRKEKIKMVNEWAQENGNTIRNQWLKMGLFLDYKNERFTLDKKSSKIVLETFVDLYNKKLIYQDWKLVNWDVKLNTAISNIEVIKKTINKKMYYIKYWLEDKSNYLTIATTRPETIFVDACLFVHPKDKRYLKYIGKKVFNPLTNELIPIMADDYIDKSFGTGIMKCTPAHDFNDYELGKKYKLKMNSCIEYDGKMNSFAKNYIGIDRLECAKKVVSFFKENNLLEKEENVESNVGFSERSNEIIEPLLSKQWFLKMKPFAKKIIENQKSKNKIIFHPKMFEKKLLEWVNNIEDWCISRQLWWGHQLPVWYHKKTNEIYVSINKPEYSKNWVQDESVLDTWFSSGLWPIILTEDDRKKYYPTDLLVTAYDIIFFWVVRMMAFSINKDNKIPFKHVYITGLIRDELGRKMSKSLGNGIDPNKLIEEKGVDSLRLFLLSNSSPGEDIRFSNQKFEASWSFLNKLWNSFRYIYEHKDKYIDKKENIKFHISDIWIINNFYKLVKSVQINFDGYNFFVGVNKIINFVKNDFCNTYLEMNKQRMNSSDDILIFTLFYMMKNILILLHPICPFITNYLYDLLPNKKFKTILEESYNFEKLKISKNSIFENSLEIIDLIRRIRFENKLSKKNEFNINISSNNIISLKKNFEQIKLLFLTENIIINEINNDEPDKDSFVLSKFWIKINNKYKNKEDNIEELKKELEKLEFEIKRSESMLNNEGFIKKAPIQKINLEKDKLKNHLERKDKILSILKK